MVQIEVEKEEDRLAVHEVHVLAFGQENEARLVEEIRQSCEFIPDLSLVAKDEKGEVVGHILFSRIYIKNHSGTVETIALSPMAVKPEYQVMGIGSMLVTEGLSRCRRLGFSHVIVLGHPGFYPKFGFVPAVKFGISPPFKLPDEVFMAVELLPGSLKEINGTVKYPAAFENV